jgi:hypothetical protein
LGGGGGGGGGGGDALAGGGDASVLQREEGGPLRQRGRERLPRGIGGERGRPPPQPRCRRATSAEGRRRRGDVGRGGPRLRGRAGPGSGLVGRGVGVGLAGRGRGTWGEAGRGAAGEAVEEGSELAFEFVLLDASSDEREGMGVDAVPLAANDDPAKARPSDQAGDKKRKCVGLEADS